MQSRGARENNASYWRFLRVRHHSTILSSIEPVHSILVLPRWREAIDRDAAVCVITQRPVVRRRLLGDV